MLIAKFVFRFGAWPEDALELVANKFLTQIEMESEIRNNCVVMCKHFHSSVSNISERYVISKCNLLNISHIQVKVKLKYTVSFYYFSASSGMKEDKSSSETLSNILKILGKSWQNYDMLYLMKMSVAIDFEVKNSCP